MHTRRATNVVEGSPDPNHREDAPADPDDCLDHRHQGHRRSVPRRKCWPQANRPLERTRRPRPSLRRALTSNRPTTTEPRLHGACCCQREQSGTKTALGDRGEDFALSVFFDETEEQEWFACAPSRRVRRPRRPSDGDVRRWPIFHTGCGRDLARGRRGDCCRSSFARAFSGALERERRIH
jgi:hypothetical protein